MALTNKIIAILLSIAFLARAFFFTRHHHRFAFSRHDGASKRAKSRSAGRCWKTLRAKRAKRAKSPTDLCSFARNQIVPSRGSGNPLLVCSHGDTNCPRPNCGRMFCRVNGVRNRGRSSRDCRIVPEFRGKCLLMRYGLARLLEIPIPSGIAC